MQKKADLRGNAFFVMAGLIVVNVLWGASSIAAREALIQLSAIEIVTLDGGKHRAKIIGLDKKTDLAVLKLDDGKATFKYARLGDSDRIQVGDWVLAVGSPFGLQATVTAGIISAKARQIGQGPFDDFLQTDAAINPGNSGGPLVNMQGEVVGINTAIAASGQGIGFAIPSNMARKIYTELRDKGRVTRGWLGVSIQPLTPELARSFGSKDAKGVLINEVMTDSPAAKAGLKPGDILLEFDGRPLDGPGDLQRAVGLFSPDRSAKVKIWRDQGEKTLEIKVGQAPDERQAQQQPQSGGGRSRSMLGLEVRPVTPEIARQLNLRTTEGVIVVRVEDGSAAAEAGVQRGDVGEAHQPSGRVEKTRQLDAGQEPHGPVAAAHHPERSRLVVAGGLDPFLGAAAVVAGQVAPARHDVGAHPRFEAEALAEDLDALVQQVGVERARGGDQPDHVAALEGSGADHSPRRIRRPLDRARLCGGADRAAPVSGGGCRAAFPASR
jgi:S1-C subfamily serine protease